MVLIEDPMKCHLFLVLILIFADVNLFNVCTTDTYRWWVV